MLGVGSQQVREPDQGQGEAMAIEQMDDQLRVGDFGGLGPEVVSTIEELRPCLQKPISVVYYEGRDD